MSDSNINQVVYSKNVIEFVTVASEYCATIEKTASYSLKENLLRLQKILPLLYLKASVLPKTERLLEEELEKYVTEFDYNLLHQNWLQLLGEYDGYYEVFDPNIQFGKETVTASMSENFLDVYQVLKDFLTSYSIGNEDVMNDTLSECIFQFEDFWGQRLVNVFRAVHMLLFSDVDFEKEIEDVNVKPGSGNPKWLENFWGTNEVEE